jgi:hypothetical protein
MKYLHLLINDTDLDSVKCIKKNKNIKDLKQEELSDGLIDGDEPLGFEDK